MFLKMRGKRAQTIADGAPRRLAWLDSRTVRTLSCGKDERNDLLPVVRAPDQPISQPPCLSCPTTAASAQSPTRVCCLCPKAARDDAGLSERHCALASLHLALQATDGGHRAGRQWVPHCRGGPDDGQQVSGRQHIHEQDVGWGLWHSSRWRQPHRGRVSPRYCPQSLCWLEYLHFMAPPPQRSCHRQGARSIPRLPWPPASQAALLRPSPAFAPQCSPWFPAPLLLPGDAPFPAARCRPEQLYAGFVQSIPGPGPVLPQALRNCGLLTELCSGFSCAYKAQWAHSPDPSLYHTSCPQSFSHGHNPGLCKHEFRFLHKFSQYSSRPSPWALYSRAALWGPEEEWCSQGLSLVLSYFLSLMWSSIYISTHWPALIMLPAHHVTLITRTACARIGSESTNLPVTATMLILLYLPNQCQQRPSLTVPSMLSLSLVQLVCRFSNRVSLPPSQLRWLLMFQRQSSARSFMFRLCMAIPWLVLLPPLLLWPQVPPVTASVVITAGLVCRRILRLLYLFRTIHYPFLFLQQKGNDCNKGKRQSIHCILLPKNLPLRIWMPKKEKN